MEPTTKEEMNNTQLIAEFMGYKKVRIGYYGISEKEDDAGESEWQTINREWIDEAGIESVGWYYVNVDENKWFEEDDLDYHKDWNKLMEAWYRFRDLRFKETRDELMHSDFKTIIGHRIAYNGIKEAYNNLVKAINWYNSAKQ